MSSQVYNPQLTVPTGGQYQDGSPVTVGQQTIIINYPKKSKRREDFKSTPAKIAGILLILCGIVAIITRGVGIHIQNQRREDFGFHLVGTAFYQLTEVLSAPFLFLAGSFALVSSKTKRVGFIITTLVFSILSAVFEIPVISSSSFAIAQEENNMKVLDSYVSSNTSESHGNETTPWSPKLSDVDAIRYSIQAGIATGVFLLLFGVIEFVGSIYISTLCCRATCCKRRHTDVTNNSQVVYLPSANIQAGGQPLQFTGTGNQAFMSYTGQQTVLQAVGGSDLPPPYTDSDVQKRDIGEGSHYPEKVPLVD